MRLFWVAMLAACGGGDDALPPELESEPGCVLASVESFDFGDRPVRSGTQGTLTLSNTCGGTLDIESVYFDVGAPHLSASPPDRPQLRDNQSATMSVAFHPMVRGPIDDVLHLITNDVDTPDLALPVTGRGLGPALDLSTSSVDFGTVAIGCAGQASVELSNVGELELTITQVAYSPTRDYFELDTRRPENGSLPFRMPPANDGQVDTRIVDTWFIPERDGDYTADLLVVSNDLRSPQSMVALTGTATTLATRTESFVLDVSIETDVVFTLLRDDTSMTDDYPRVFSNLDDYAARAVAVTSDPQIALVSADDGCVLGPDRWIDAHFSSGEAADALDTMADLGHELAPRMRDFRKGSELARRALAAANTGSGGCNEGLLRDHARLMVVHISDYPDESPDAWDTYVDDLRALKMDPDWVTVHAVAGDVPGGCETALPGTGFYAQTVETGGLFYSVCRDGWGDTLPLPSREWLSWARFPLAGQPVPHTLSATLDGRDFGSFSYDRDTNTVMVARGVAPEDPAKLVIDYVVQPDCGSR